MYISYQNTVCLPLSKLFDYGVLESEGTYHSWRNRGHLKVVRSGFDKTKTLINAEEMRPDIKAKVVALFGDPKDKHKLILANFIEWDKESEDNFRSYRYNDDKSLPEPTINEYTVSASVLNAVKRLLNDELAHTKVSRGQVWENITKAVANLDKSLYPHKLPANVRSLKAKYEAYALGKVSDRYPVAGWKGLIHRNFGNEFTAKLTQESKEWILARWCNQVMKCASLAHLHDEYNQKAIAEGWKTVQDEKTFYNFLYSEDIQPLWWAHRHGEKAADEKFGFQHTTILPTRRDSLWYSDGTKLNFYFKDEDGQMKTAWVYEVMDAFSEVFLGFNVSKDTERFEDQYKAYKMAIQKAGHRPFEIKFDNQGGHKKLIASEFFVKMARIAVRTKPYNGKSKTIESAFGRFQKQIMKKCWFFTGQNITTKTQESKANMEFILANKKNLPSYQEAVETYIAMRNEWNQAKHHQSGLSRIETYQNSHNEKTPTVDVWDMVNMFWVWHSKGEKVQPITFTPGGLSFVVNKQKFEYMVYDESGLPDQDFIDRAVDKKFYLKYDPEMMDEVYLYEKDHGGERFVTVAKLKLNIHRATQDQTEGENRFIKQVDEAKNAHRIERFERMEAILETHGMAAWQQGFNTPKVRGAHKTKDQVKQKTSKASAIADEDYDKQVSNLTQNDIYNEW
ncbi:hypothetical protein [Weeksella virosa]|uniref:Integrase catalytic region n=1 Tax=Weeksella virosa (strain ATCC 43766 / DSM 16922 / JCM 21250 / CCUG 30538 / CDC 9751 / IAM 14551 / NBRC 16016 / NCTC 11634 / CL345/78) TaxID=865938 RepID=F0NX92_WEEVC|nr:hypothetical protein [Weeksella virosa]ADX66866.1 hypothetical protein Weevi_0140 [Weeksella virosa DSM 16922]MDK7675072.1 hypothetical protein [Weeksella virosa]VEH63410.1 Uncharacterised protein [Weeksella virosa]